MASETAAERYEAVELTENGEKPLGTVEFDAAGTLTVREEKGAAKDGALARIAQQVNGKKVMYVEAPPPEGSPRFTLASRIVNRGEPDFIPALKNYLRTYYKIELRPQ